MLAEAGLTTGFQREDDAQGGPDARHRIAHIVADGLGRSAGCAGDVHPARHGLNGEVVGRPVRIGAATTISVAIPVAGDLRVDEAGVDLPQAIVSKSQPAKGSRTPVVQQHVGVGNQILEGDLAGGVAQIEGNAFLVAVDAKEAAADLSSVRFADEWATATRQIAGAWTLDLDYFGAHVGQNQRAEWAGDDVGGIQNADAFKGQGEGGVNKHW